MRQVGLQPRLEQDILDLHQGGIIVVAWMADRNGYLFLSNDIVLIRWEEDGKERSVRARWDQLVLEHYLVDDGTVRVTLNAQHKRGDRWIITLHSGRGGMDALAFILGRTRG